MQEPTRIPTVSRQVGFRMKKVSVLACLCVNELIIGLSTPRRQAREADLFAERHLVSCRRTIQVAPSMEFRSAHNRIAVRRGVVPLPPVGKVSLGYPERHSRGTRAAVPIFP